MASKEREINRAKEEEPRSGHRAPARGGVGEERKYSNRAWGDDRERITSTPHTGKDLGGAIEELHRQHPIKHHQLGPHHGKDYHDRHEPMHGMHSKARHGR